MENRIHRLRIGIAWFTLFVVGTDLFVVSPLLPDLSRQFLIGSGMAGWVVSVFSMMYALGAPFFGEISDRVGKRKTIFIGLLGFAAGNALTSLATSFPLLLGGRVLTGLSAAAITPSVYAVTGDVAARERRGASLAIVTSGLLTALWAGAPIGTLINQSAGWRTVFAGLAASSLALAAFNRRVWPESKPAGSPVAKGAARGELQSVLFDVSVTAFWGAAVYGWYTYLGTGLRLYDHFSPGLVAVALVFYGVGATSGSLSGGRLADHWGAARVSTASLAGLAILLGMAALLFKTRAGLFPLLLLWAFVGYAFFPAFQSRLAERFSERRGMAMAWNNTALYAGITIGSLMGGWVITQWPFRALPLTSAGVALAGALLSLIRTRRTAATRLLSPAKTAE